MQLHMSCAIKKCCMQSCFLVTCDMCKYIKQVTKYSFSTSGLGVMFITKITQDSKRRDILKSTSGYIKCGV
jgi:hypothetical protein